MIRRPLQEKAKKNIRISNLINFCSKKKSEDEGIDNPESKQFEVINKYVSYQAYFNVKVLSDEMKSSIKKNHKRVKQNQSWFTTEFLK